MNLSIWTMTLLCAAALAAGFVDAIAGGGGLITLPVLMTVGVPPHLALGTNKGQSVFGSGAALFRFIGAGLVDGRRARWTFPMGLLGSLLGAWLVLRLEPGTLRPLVLALLVFAGVVVALHGGRRPPTLHAVSDSSTRRRMWVAALIALVIGTYDGFFGPGTGTFLIVAFVSLLGATLPQATADAKVVNFASNVSAVALFTNDGFVLWNVALPMAAAQLLGGFLGAHTAVRGGARVIRVTVLLVVFALVVRLSYELLTR